MSKKNGVKTVSLVLHVSLFFSLLINSAGIQAELEEIIVTAQKHEQSQQDVPISVSAISGERIEESGIRDVFDLQAIAPGLIVQQNQSATTTKFIIRGVGTNTQNFGLESSVGLYVDGVYRSRQSSVINDLSDIDRVEILRGPQGTLFGRNTPSGALQINTRQPDHDGTGFAEINYGNFDLKTISGAKSISLIEDVLAMRATGFTTERDGWIDDIGIGEDNAVNNRDRFGFRLQGLYTPNDDLSVRVILDYSEIDETCCGTLVLHDNNAVDQRRVNRDPNPFPLGTDSLLETRGTFIPGSRAFDRVVAYSQLPESTNKDAGISVEVNWYREDYVITSITAWRDFNTFDNIDSDFMDVDGLLVSNKGELQMFTQELRVVGQWQRLHYVSGLYFFTQDLDSLQKIATGEDTTDFASIFEAIDLRLLEELLDVVAFPADAFVTNTSFQDQKSWAVFGQVDYDLLDDLTLTAGLRYTKEQKALKAIYDEFNPGAGFDRLDAIAPRGDIDDDLDAGDGENVSGTIKLSWFMNDDIMFYLSYGTGYKSGGFNTDRISQFVDSEFGPEKSKAFETGMKADFPDHDLRLNVALHQTKVEDLQVNAFTGTGFNLRNAAEADTYGAEIELLWQPLPQFMMTAAYVRSVADFDKFPEGNCWLASPFRGVPDPGAGGAEDPDFCSRAGGRLGGNPEDFFTTTVRTGTVINDMMTAFVLLEYIYYGDQMMEDSNDPLELQSSYQLVNLRTGLIFDQYDADLTLWGRNIFDEDYHGIVFDPPLQEGKLLAFATSVRTFGITARKNF